MKQPSLLVQLAGTPGVAIPLTLAGLWLIYAWTQGRASVWLALAGCFIATRAVSSARQRARYKAWRTQWDAVATLDKAPPRRPIKVNQLVTVIALVSFFGLIAFGTQIVADNPDIQNSLIWLWVVSGAFLAAKAVAYRRRSRARGSCQNEAGSERKGHIVTWTLEKTLDAPSREEAMRSLPMFAARILSR